MFFFFKGYCNILKSKLVHRPILHSTCLILYWNLISGFLTRAGFGRDNMLVELPGKSLLGWSLGWWVVSDIFNTNNSRISYNFHSALYLVLNVCWIFTAVGDHQNCSWASGVCTVYIPSKSNHHFFDRLVNEPPFFKTCPDITRVFVSFPMGQNPWQPKYHCPPKRLQGSPILCFFFEGDLWSFWWSLGWSGGMWFGKHFNP